VCPAEAVAASGASSRGDMCTEEAWEGFDEGGPAAWCEAGLEKGVPGVSAVSPYHPEGPEATELASEWAPRSAALLPGPRPTSGVP